MNDRPKRKRYRKDPLVPGSEPIPNAMEIWHALAPLDEVAKQMEQKWGIERLPGLVSEITAAKFGSAREHLNRMLGDNDDGQGDTAEIAAAAENLRKGWHALDVEATAAGAEPLDPTAWSFMAGGKPCAIVRDSAAAAVVQSMLSESGVYTLEEIGQIIVAFQNQFPKEAVIGSDESGIIKPKPPASEWSVDLDDEIPF